MIRRLVNRHRRERVRETIEQVEVERRLMVVEATLRAKGAM